MDLYEVADQIVKLLQQRGKLTYRVLKLQFKLDNEMLEALKDELLYSQPQAVDDNGKGLIWTGDPAAPEPDARHRMEPDLRFHALLPMVIGLLRAERRVTYRALKDVLDLGEALLEKIREELTLRQLAVDEEGMVLVWAGETQPRMPSVVDIPNQPATADTTAVTSSTVSIPPPVAESRTPSNGPTIRPETASTDVLQDEPMAQASTRTAPEAERRQLTVMFCDLADSTNLSQQLDPEDLREVIRAYQATSAEVVQQYAGHVAQYLGDGLLIYFGWPVAHENDAQRSLHAGLGIVEAITTTLNARLARDKHVQLAVRIGIHTGPVVVGEMGGAGRHENLATGESVNIAARLEGLAAPNTVMISSVTERLVRGTFALEDLGPKVLKGVEEPIGVFRVTRTLDTDRDDESIPEKGMFLVGRDEEVGLLLRRWQQSKEGLGQVVLISGEAGIGKSSLVATVRNHMHHEGTTHMAFRCSPYHQNSALYPVITHLERMLEFSQAVTADSRLERLEQLLRKTNFPLNETVPLLSTLLSIPLADRYSTPTGSPRQQRQQTLDVLIGWLMEEAERRPMLVAWEDLHWADPSTLDMLVLLLEQAPTVPMLQMLTFRPAFEQPWPLRSHMTPITLNRLERPQIRALLAHLVGDKMLPAEVVEHIVERTDGVPLYVEELTKMLLASDLLREDGDQYALTGPLLKVAIPDTLQDSLMARLDQLHSAKEIAQLGAVLGREFSYDMLRAIAPQGDDTLQAELTKLVDAELLYQRGRVPRARYLFKNALIQDAAYTSLLRSTRQQVHRQVARVLEGQFSDTVETQPELLAYHCTEAGLAESAVDYWIKAGQRAHSRSAHIEAIAHFRNGLEVLHTLPDNAERTQRDLTLHLALIEALQVAKGYAAPEVADTFARLHAISDQLTDNAQRFQLLWGQIAFHTVHGDAQVACGLGEQMVEITKHDPDDVRHLVAHRSMGTALSLRGDFARALHHFDQVLALYKAQPQHSSVSRIRQDPVTACFAHGAMILWLLGYPDQARQRSEEAIAQATQLAHPFSLGYALYYNAQICLLRGELQDARALIENLMSLSSQHAFTQLSVNGARMQTLTFAGQCPPAETITDMQRHLDHLRAIGEGQELPPTLLLLAEVYGQNGGVEQGLELVAETLSIIDQTGARRSEAEAYRVKGRLLLQQAIPDMVQAETCFHEALNVARRQQAKSLELRAATSLTRLWQSQGKRREAYELLQPVYDWFTEGFDTADLKDAKALLQALEG